MPVKFLGVNINPLLEVNVIFFFFPFCFIFKGCIFHSLSNGHFFFFLSLSVVRILPRCIINHCRIAMVLFAFFFVLRGTCQDLAYV